MLMNVYCLSFDDMVSNDLCAKITNNLGFILDDTTLKVKAVNRSDIVNADILNIRKHLFGNQWLIEKSDNAYKVNGVSIEWSHGVLSFDGKGIFRGIDNLDKKLILRSVSKVSRSIELVFSLDDHDSTIVSSVFALVISRNCNLMEFKTHGTWFYNIEILDRKHYNDSKIFVPYNYLVVYWESDRNIVIDTRNGVAKFMSADSIIDLINTDKVSYIQDFNEYKFIDIFSNYDFNSQKWTYDIEMNGHQLIMYNHDETNKQIIYEDCYFELKDSDTIVGVFLYDGMLVILTLYTILVYYKEDLTPALFYIKSNSCKSMSDRCKGILNKTRLLTCTYEKVKKRG